MKKKILISGGAGFIGSNLANKLSESKQFEIHVCDNLLTGNKKYLNKSILFHNIDVNCFKKVSYIFNKYKFDYVFHYAAVVGVNRTLDDPIKVLEDIKGLENIFKLSVSNKIKRIFFSSSSEVYGEPVHMPQNEEITPLNSKLPYAVVKNLGENFCKAYFFKYKLNYNILRFFNTYGHNQSEDFVISSFIKLAKSNKPIKIFGDGNQSRTFCHINDNVDTTINLIKNYKYSNQIINIGHNKIYTINELAKKIIKIFNSNSKIIHVKARKDGDMTRRQPDNSKMIKILNRRLITLDQGLKMFRKNN